MTATKIKNRFTISVSTEIAKFIQKIPSQNRSKTINKIIEQEMFRQNQLAQFRKLTNNLPNLDYLEKKPTKNRQIDYI